MSTMERGELIHEVATTTLPHILHQCGNVVCAVWLREGYPFVDGVPLHGQTLLGVVIHHGCDFDKNFDLVFLASYIHVLGGGQEFEERLAVQLATLMMNHAPSPALHSSLGHVWSILMHSCDRELAINAEGIVCRSNTSEDGPEHEHGVSVSQCACEDRFGFDGGQHLGILDKVVVVGLDVGIRRIFLDTYPSLDLGPIPPHCIDVCSQSVHTFLGNDFNL